MKYALQLVDSLALSVSFFSFLFSFWFKQKCIRDKMKIQKIVVCSSTSFQLMGDELIQLGRRKKNVRWTNNFIKLRRNIKTLKRDIKMRRNIKNKTKQRKKKNYYSQPHPLLDSHLHPPPPPHTHTHTHPSPSHPISPLSVRMLPSLLSCSFHRATGQNRLSVMISLHS